MNAKPKSKEEFDIESVSSVDMESWINECVRIYQGEPSWLNGDDHIDTICFAKAICSETARLATLGIGIHIDGSARAEWLQRQIDRVYYQLRNWVEYGCAYGTVILKPNGDNIQLYTVGEFEITHSTDGIVDGAVFHNHKKVGDKWYTRLEYNRFEDGVYVITNKCYVGDYPDDTKDAVDIKNTPWSGLVEEVYIENIEQPLFGVLRMPQANNIDLDSPYGLPVFSEAVQELRDLDIAYSRNAKEILDSKRTVLLDADRLLPYGHNGALNRSNLPDYVKLVDGDTNVGSDVYHEINPNINTATRLDGINALLSQIGYKVGFSNGYFVFNEATGIQTATGVEAEQQRTVQFIKDVRDKLENCMDGLIYALNVFADLYGLAPAGVYEAAYDFGDITYNRDEDRSRWWSYVVSGKVPAWMFFVKFEGMTEDDAKAMLAETSQQPSLFGEDE
jgi:A118 family predicted phage portal protein